MKILLTGSTGQIGSALSQLLLPEHELIAPTRATLDLADLQAVSAFLNQQRFDLILNPAAYTAVDKAESEPELAHTLNAELPAVLAVAAHKMGARLVHYSTDYVFDGKKRTPWLETDAVNPLSVYGKTKLAGEQAVLALSPEALVFRTSWVYSRVGKNMFNTIWRVSQEREELAFVNDQCGVPNWAPYLAELTLAAITRDIAPGLYHLSAGGETTWFGFVESIIKHLPEGMRRPLVRPINSEQYPTPVKRPAYSVLDNRKLALALAQQIEDWPPQLLRCLRN
ncbi:MAG: dTDP-4-dehydrorhamnose reductase [Pseudomonadota bacterium]|jgi:dTDP-4-dehydrorhamnose reductase